jgi:hypothetical protein
LLIQCTVSPGVATETAVERAAVAQRHPEPEDKVHAIDRGTPSAP